MSTHDADVIVVGAGPSGLLVTLELARAGVRVLTLERRGEPALSRAGTLQPRVLEIFDARGLADRILARADELHAQPRTSVSIWGGFHGIRYDLLDTDFPYVLMLTQLEVERTLQEEAIACGAIVRREVEVTAVRQDGDSVTVETRERDGSVRALTADYVVGADGSRSTVRSEIGVGFDGRPADRTAINVDAALDFPWAHHPYVTDNLNGWGLTYPLKDGLTRFALIDAVGSHGDPQEPATVEEGKQALRNIYGTDFGITEATVSRFHNAMFLAGKMRVGRVFLVGESVRVHYPASGVGMNFCLQDAFNLGWKLAAAVQGWAPHWLLDSYEQERRPEIIRLLDDVRRQCAVQFAFTEEMLAMKRMIEYELIPIPEVNRLLAEGLAGLAAHYAPGAPSHPLVGRRLRDLDLIGADGSSTRVHDLLRAQRFVLIDLTAGEVPDVPVPMARALRIWSGKPAVNKGELAGVDAVLLRPDGHVAWVGSARLAGGLPDEELAHWIGTR